MWHGVNDDSKEFSPTDEKQPNGLILASLTYRGIPCHNYEMAIYKLMTGVPSMNRAEADCRVHSLAISQTPSPTRHSKVSTISRHHVRFRAMRDTAESVIANTHFHFSPESLQGLSLLTAVVCFPSS